MANVIPGGFENDIHHNGHLMWRSGISIGHKDADNLLVGNHVYENCKYGVCIRRKTEANGAHRCVYRENVIENNGQDLAGIPEDCKWLPDRERVACGVHVEGVTKDLTFERNVIRETRPEGQQWQRHALYLAPDVSGCRMIENEMAGHPDDDIVDESGTLNVQ